jgi:phosphoglucomutase
MAEKISPLAGKPAPASLLVDVARLIAAYYGEKPDPGIAAQRVAFGTSGHRGSAFTRSFNEDHILAISQAICLHRRQKGIDGPLFIGIDTHALSRPALISAMEVFAANDVEAMIDAGGAFTPTPVISHAILTYNRGRKNGLADGVVVTPSHNPPEDGGFKYNPPNGGPADTDVTGWIERTANDFLIGKLAGVQRMPAERAFSAPTTHRHDYVTPYVDDLSNVVDMDAIRGSKLKIGIDPLGGASVHFWSAIAARYGIDATNVNDRVDPTFAFMTVDWDGRIRMDCSSPYAMKRLVGLRNDFDIAFANDTDADRHGIVTRSGGLMNPNHYLAAAIHYLFSHREAWPKAAAVGKTVVSSAVIDRVAQKLGRSLFEVPVGFKWFVDGLLDGSLGFGGEESAGASFLRRDGSVWTTDKDGLILGLLAAEMTAKTGKDPSQIHAALVQETGEFFYERIDAPASAAQKEILSKRSAAQFSARQLAGDPIKSVISQAPGNKAPIGGIKVSTDNGWFAARPSGTEEIYKIYAESFRSQDHLRRIQQEAQSLISAVFDQAKASA